MGDYNNSGNDAFMRNNPALQVRPKVAPRQNIQQLKLMGQAHPTGLTNQLLKLFEPRPPLEFKPPPERRKLPPYSGMAQFVSKFAEPGAPEYAPPVQEAETPSQRRERIHELRLEKGAEKAAEELQKYDPNNDPDVTGDPYKNLFVARLNYETSESRIKREFETYGPIKRVGISEHPVEGSVRLITDTETNKPKGYAFIEYMHTRDMKTAYKQADGKKLDNRRVLVDVERGRTVPNWRPRRLGGGLGTTRVGGEDVNQKYSGREQQQSGPSRSEEPRIREDRHGDREREKSRERVREREKSREQSHDRPRDRDHREDRHHRDRDRNRDRDREKDHGRDRERTRDRDSRRDRDRGRDYERDRDKDRDRERERDHGWNRPREREKERDRDYEVEDAEDYGRGRSHDREADYERDRHGEKDQEYDLPEGVVAYYDGRKRSEPDRNYEQYGHASRSDYDNMDTRENDDRYDNERDQYDPMEDSYNYQSRDYRSSERSHSREYDR